MPMLTEVDKDSLKRYQRALANWLERSGVERKDRQLVQETMPQSSGPDDRKRTFQIWLRDSLLWTCEEIEAGRDLYAFRGLLQSSGYAGTVGHDSITQDAFLTLRNLLERTYER